MTKILATKPLAENLLHQTAIAVNTCPIPPHLHVIVVGDNPASITYVRHKQKAAAKAGIACTIHYFPTTISQSTLNAFLKSLNTTPEVTGILLQLPLPSTLDTLEALNTITSLKDVDGLTDTNQAHLNTGTAAHALLPATPLGVMRILEWSQTPVKHQQTVIMGQSRLVGASLATLLTQAGAKVTSFNSESLESNKQKALANATLVISAAGVPNLIRGEHLAPNAIVIDIGINRIPSHNGKTALVGDVHTPSVIGKVKALTPVPGGVGPLTIASLLTNVVDATFLQANQPKHLWEIPSISA